MKKNQFSSEVKFGLIARNECGTDTEISSVSPFCPTGQREDEARSVTIYPNPITYNDSQYINVGLKNIDIEKPIKFNILRGLDSYIVESGELIQQEQRINIAEIMDGVYYFQIFLTDGKMINEQFVISKN